MTKVELTHKGFGGPYNVKLNDTVIEDVENIELHNDGKVARLHITILVDNFSLTKEEYTPEEKVLNALYRYQKGGHVK